MKNNNGFVFVNLIKLNYFYFKILTIIKYIVFNIEIKGKIYEH